MSSAQIQYFTTPAQLRAWLAKNPAKATELHVGFHKRGAGKPTITWPQSVAEALCYGWIDGVRRTVDGNRYVIRFTPRKPGSTWSATNIRMAKELESAGRMTDSGRAAFAARVDAKSKKYSYEQKDVQLDDELLRKFKNNRNAWNFFTVQAPSYQKKVLWWITSAKAEDARQRRLARALAASAARKRLA